MGKHVFLKVLVVTILMLILGVYLSPQKDIAIEEKAKSNVYPWQIELLASGHTRIFNITIGQSTLAQAEDVFNEKSEIILFVGDDSKSVVEAYFNLLKIAGLKSKMVITMTLSADKVKDMYQKEYKR